MLFYPVSPIGDYESAKHWSGRRDSNARHPAWKAGTLPTELHPLLPIDSHEITLDNAMANKIRQNLNDVPFGCLWPKHVRN